MPPTTKPVVKPDGYLLYRLVRGEGPETKIVRAGGETVKITPGVPFPTSSKIGQILLDRLGPKVVVCDELGQDENGIPIDPNLPRSPGKPKKDPIQKVPPEQRRQGPNSVERDMLARQAAARSLKGSEVLPPRITRQAPPPGAWHPETGTTSAPSTPPTSSETTTTEGEAH